MRNQEQLATEAGANNRAPYTLTKQRAYPTGSLPARGFGVPTTYIGMSRGQRNSLAHRVSVPRDIAGRLSGRDKCPNTLAANHGCWSLRLLQLPHGNWKAVSFVLPFHEFTNLRIFTLGYVFSSVLFLFASRTPSSRAATRTSPSELGATQETVRRAPPACLSAAATSRHERPA